MKAHQTALLPGDGIGRLLRREADDNPAKIAADHASRYGEPTSG